MSKPALDLIDPAFNKQPHDPAWAALADTLTRDAAVQLGCMVVLVAIQPDALKGKAICCVEGVPESGPVRELADDPAALLAWAAYIIRLSQDMAALQAKGATKQ